MRVALALVAMLLVGCREKVDPCQGVTGTCLALEVESAGAIGSVESLFVRVWADGLNTEQTTTPSRGSAVELPAAVALLVPSVAAGTHMQAHVAVYANARGRMLAGGNTTAMLNGGAHSSATVVLAAAGAGPSVTFESPNADAHVDGVVHVVVGASPGADFVDLFVDGTLFATRSAPDFEFMWDSTTVAEGPHMLTATATLGGSVASQSLPLVVDRTPPTVVTVSPANGSSTVDTLEPITMTFSEPIAPTSVGSGSIRLTSDDGTTFMPGAPTLSSDGKTLTIPFAALPPLPAHLTVTPESSITDVAGNALVATPWSFSVPAWIPIGDKLPLGAMTVAAGPNGEIVAASSLFAGADVGVERWRNGAWQLLGNGLNLDPSWNASSPHLLGIAVDEAGQPAVFMSWLASSDGTGAYGVAQWSDATMSWQFLGAPMTGGSTSAVATNARDGLVFAYAQPEGIYVRKWDGSAWQMPGTALHASTGAATEPTIASDGKGHISVGFRESFSSTVADTSLLVYNWDGKQFQSATYSGSNGLGLGLNPYPGATGVTQPQIGIDGSGFPIVAFVESRTPGGFNDLFVFQGGWGGFTELTGEPVHVGAGIALAIDSLGRPVVMYHDSPARPNAFIIRWDGVGSWVQLGAGPVAVAIVVPLAIDSHDRPITAAMGVILRSNQ